ncbi:MAG: hypothetical protein GY742_01530 [Hyphomicrobiales bacterium]|nr:hypothetical protein [Hyphomicrobiales bacterium]
MNLKPASFNHNQLFERIDLLNKQVALNTTNTGAMLELCGHYLSVGRPDKTIPVAQRCLQLDKKNLQALRHLFDSNFALYRLDEAKFAVTQAMKLIPEKEPLMLDMAACLETEGLNEEAGEIYKRLIKQVAKNSKHRSVVVARGAMFGSGVENDLLYDELVALLRRERIRSPNRPILHQAAAKIAEGQGRIGDAFSHYAKAGKSTARSLPSETFTARAVERIRNAFTAGTYGRYAMSGSDSTRPIFVFGMQRSGTTLTEQILSSHPSIYGAGELPYFDIVSNWHLPGQEDAKILEKTASDYLELLQAYAKDAERVVDKMPGNFRNLWLMAAAFPNAYFIHCRRDPLDTCVACFKRPIKKAYRRDLVSIGRYYRNYSELMDHWKKVLPVKMFEMNYEELVAEPEHQIRKLISHVEMEWDDACLTPHQTKRVVNTPSRNQVSAPIHKSAIGSWRQYEKYVEPLIKELGDMAVTEQVANRFSAS